MTTQPTKLRIASNILLTLTIPSIPILYWYKTAQDDRKSHIRAIETKIRIPNVQTVDDLLVDKCQPGDVIVFDRRCDRCAASPLAAFACVVNRSLLCNEMDRGRAVEAGKYDHCGVVVPGRKAFGALEILEATAGEGIVSRPLLTRLEMARSRNVTLLPLQVPGERRLSDVEPESARLTRERMDKELARFRDSAERVSREQHYSRSHSLLSLFGALSYALGLQPYSPSPVSPSAWLVVSALQYAGAAENVNERAALDAKVEDFLRDFRFQEKETVTLRPGWKFLRPVPMRETSRS